MGSPSGWSQRGGRAPWNLARRDDPRFVPETIAQGFPMEAGSSSGSSSHDPTGSSTSMNSVKSRDRRCPASGLVRHSRTQVVPTGTPVRRRSTHLSLDHPEEEEAGVTGLLTVVLAWT